MKDAGRHLDAGDDERGIPSHIRSLKCVTYEQASRIINDVTSAHYPAFARHRVPDRCAAGGAALVLGLAKIIAYIVLLRLVKDDVKLVVRPLPQEHRRLSGRRTRLAAPISLGSIWFDRTQTRAEREQVVEIAHRMCRA